MSCISRGLPGGRETESDAIAAAVLAVGGVLLARSRDDEKQAARIERACRHHVERLLTDGPKRTA